MHWETVHELRAWITGLMNDWSWLGSGVPAARRAWESIVSACGAAQNHLDQAANYTAQGNEQAASQARIEAQRSLENFIRGQPWILPTNARRLFVFELKDAGHEMAAGLIVANWLGHDLSGAPIREIVWSLVQLEMFERGVKDRMKTENSALKRLAGDLQTKLSEMQALEREQIARFNSAHGNLDGQLAEQQAQFDAAQNDRSTAWSNQLSEASESLKHLLEAYDAHMSLAAPVKYWEAKQRRHRNWMIGSAIVLAAGMASAGSFLHYELQAISVVAVKQAVGQATVSDVPKPADASRSQLPTEVAASAGVAPQGADSGRSTVLGDIVGAAATWRLGSFILLATLCFWALRLLVRIFLSNMHLENDASERVTMAKTYLSLLRKGRLPEKSDISVVLAALFRPSGDGIVKDEGVPPTTLEWFTKLGK